MSKTGYNNRVQQLLQTPDGRLIKCYLIAQLVRSLYPLVPEYVEYRTLLGHLKKSGLVNSKQALNHILSHHGGYPSEDERL